MTTWLAVIGGFLLGCYVATFEDRDDPFGAVVGIVMFTAIVGTLIVLVYRGIVR